MNRNEQRENKNSTNFKMICKSLQANGLVLATHAQHRMQPTRTEALDAISQVMLQLQAHVCHFERSVKQCPRVSTNRPTAVHFMERKDATERKQYHIPFQKRESKVKTRKACLVVLKARCRFSLQSLLSSAEQATSL